MSKNYPGLLIGAAIMGFMHLKLGYTQPLLLQSIMPLKSLYDNPILKVCAECILTTLGRVTWH